MLSMKNHDKDYNKINLQIKIPEDMHDESSSESSDFKVSGWGYRHQQCLILFFCLMTALSMRACMGVALVAMVDNNVNTDPETVTLDNDTVINETNNILYKDTNMSNNNIKITHDENIEIKSDAAEKGALHSLLLLPPYPKFQWTKKTQDTVQSSFFWGYMLLQIPAGQLAHHFGARYLLTSALLINSVTCFCLPWAAYYGGWILMMIFRIVQGLSQACVIPGVHTILGKWTPLEERGRLAGWAYGGSVLGTVLGLTVTGFIASTPLGWPGIFRFYGILAGLVGTIIWIFGADTPAQHPKISLSERRYIEERLRHTGQKKHAVPWASILRCRGTWAIVVAHIGQTWGQLTFYTEVPSFMDKVMGVNIKANGVLTALPYLIMWFTNFFFTWFTDMLIVKKILSVANTRKLANSLGSVPVALGFIVLAYIPKNIYAVEIVLIIICTFKVASNVGFHINHIDISSNYSGTLISISNFASNMFGSLAPLVAGLILTDVTSEYLWRKVFFVASGLYFTSNIVFVVFGEGEKAEWDNPPTEELKEDLKESEAMVQENNKNEYRNGGNR